jgi:hypothetical protein
MSNHKKVNGTAGAQKLTGENLKVAWPELP